jgi:hypothetical protein
MRHRFGLCAGRVGFGYHVRFSLLNQLRRTDLILNQLLTPVRRRCLFAPTVQHCTQIIGHSVIVVIPIILLIVRPLPDPVTGFTD